MDKAEKFERLAEKRVTEAIKKIKLIGNLSNRNNYSYSDEQTKQIFDVLDYEVKSLKERFRETPIAEGYKFSFKKK